MDGNEVAETVAGYNELFPHFSETRLSGVSAKHLGLADRHRQMAAVGSDRAKRDVL